MTSSRNTKIKTSPKTLPRPVIIIGLVSLLNDFASEMVVPLIPILLATVLSAGPVALGFIEGLADAVSNLLKLWAGRRSDVRGRYRKPYVVIGYTLSNIARPLIGLSGSWLTVLIIRVTDRIGKGVRTAPRDALLADAIPDGAAGHAYGFTRAMDHAGAVLGALAAAAIVYWGTQRLELVIALSAIPGLLAVGLIIWGVKEPRRVSNPAAKPAPLSWSRLDRPTRHYLLVLGLFSLGKIPETFLLLRGYELGMDVVQLLILWAGLHVVKSISAEFGGRSADRFGRRPLILLGWIVYAGALAALAFATTPLALWLGTLVLGFYFGLTEGAERALVRDLAATTERGTAFGWYHMVIGLSSIPAGVLLGSIWSQFGVASAFAVSVVTALIAWFGFWRFVRAT